MKNDYKFLKDQLYVTRFCLDNIDAVFYLSASMLSGADTLPHTNIAHEHAWYELHCVKKGICEIQTNEKRFAIKPNEALFLTPRTYHNSKISGDNIQCVSLGFELFKNAKISKENLYASMTKCFGDAGVKKLANCSTLANLIVDLLIYLKSGGDLSDCRSHNMLSTFLFSLSDKLSKKNLDEQSIQTKEPNLSKDNRNYLLDLLTSNEIDKMTLDELSQKIYLNKKQINSIVKKRYHTTYKQKQIRFRIENAKKMLAESTLPVDIIAHQVGYSNLTSFYKTFQKITGKTPAEYRKQRSDTH